MRVSGAGLELSAVTVGFGFAGWLIDQSLGLERPVAMILSGLVGFTFAMYRFVRLAIRVSEEQRTLEADARRNRGAVETETIAADETSENHR